MNLINKYWREQPILLILLIALLFRLVSVVYSKGYGMVDDHFLVI